MYYQTLNEYADQLFFEKYIVEAQGISYELISVTDTIYNSIKNKINSSYLNKLIYTGYNWNFDKKEFIKICDKNTEYPLYIKIVDNIKSAGYTYRNIKKEVDNTNILIILSIDIHKNDLHTVIRHELQHVKELYILKNKNVIEYDKTNIYNSPYLDSNFKKCNRDLFYPLSKSEQHAIIQEIYDYVIDNQNITKTSLLDNKLELISKIPNFYLLYRYYLNFIGLGIYYYDLNILNIGYILKTNFNYKNNRITKSYINHANTFKLEKIGISILMDIMRFLEEQIQKFQRKVLRTIYLAIEDRQTKLK